MPLSFFSGIPPLITRAGLLVQIDQKLKSKCRCKTAKGLSYNLFDRYNKSFFNNFQYQQSTRKASSTKRFKEKTRIHGFTPP